MNLAAKITVIAFSLLLPHILLAAPSTLKEAQENVTKAYQQYYDAISGKGLSGDKQKEIADKILTPANREMDEFLTKHVRKSVENVVNDLRKKSPKISGKGGSPAPVAGGAPTAPKSKAAPQPKAPEPVVIQGGGEAPNEIEFPGKKKN